MILVTGGAGYIGSHTIVELLNNNENIIVVDNFYNSKQEVLERIKAITNKDFLFYKIDLKNIMDLQKVFIYHKIDSVIHFAAYKSVGESVEKPLEYYSNNIESTLNLLNLMKKYDVNKFVFSSSATVYGSPKTCPIKEGFNLKTTNPYGATKLMIEDMLRDICKSNKKFNVAILRYFNPVGSHSSYLIGEEPNGIPNNLMPYISKVASKELEKLSIFGNDYDTPDGTGVRDYIHVVDLAKGHLAALNKLNSNPGLVTYNLGTGKGYSVLELVNTFSKVNNIDVPYVMSGRRAGDIASCYADCTKAKDELNWTAKLDIEDMCKDAWSWELNRKRLLQSNI